MGLVAFERGREAQGSFGFRASLGPQCTKGKHLSASCDVWEWYLSAFYFLKSNQKTSTIMNKHQPYSSSVNILKLRIALKCFKHDTFLSSYIAYIISTHWILGRRHREEKMRDAERVAMKRADEESRFVLPSCGHFSQGNSCLFFFGIHICIYL